MPLPELGKNLCLSAHEQGIFLSLERPKKNHYTTVLSFVEIHNFGFMFYLSSFLLAKLALPGPVNTLILQYGWEGLKEKFVPLPEAGPPTGIPVS